MKWMMSEWIRFECMGDDGWVRWMTAYYSCEVDDDGWMGKI